MTARSKEVLDEQARARMGRAMRQEILSILALELLVDATADHQLDLTLYSILYVSAQILSKGQAVIGES